MKMETKLFCDRLSRYVVLPVPGGPLKIAVAP